MRFTFLWHNSLPSIFFYISLAHARRNPEHPEPVRAGDLEELWEHPAVEAPHQTAEAAAEGTQQHIHILFPFVK